MRRTHDSLKYIVNQQNSEMLSFNDDECILSQSLDLNLFIILHKTWILMFYSMPHVC